MDLCSLEEVSERPEKVFNNMYYFHIDIFQNITNEGASLGDFIKIGSSERTREYMIEAALSVSEKNSFLFHCFAGKDWTGVSVALLLGILAVPQPTIYQDYLETNTLRVKENQEIIQLAKDNGASKEVTDALDIALNVEVEFLDIFYQTVANEFGSMDNYLTNTLHISKNMQKDLRTLLLD